MFNADHAVINSACAANKIMMVKGPGQGRKICPTCRTINIGPARKICTNCKCKFPIFGATADKAKNTVRNTEKPKVKQTSKAHRIGAIQVRMAELHRELSELHTKLALLTLED